MNLHRTTIDVVQDLYLEVSKGKTNSYVLKQVLIYEKSALMLETILVAPPVLSLSGQKHHRMTYPPHGHTWGEITIIQLSNFLLGRVYRPFQCDLCIYRANIVQLVGCLPRQRTTCLS